jgi:hypothetical protein
MLNGSTYEKWYVYAKNAYQIPTDISCCDKRILFFIMAITSVGFSPIGKELFFRENVYSSFTNSIG